MVDLLPTVPTPAIVRVQWGRHLSGVKCYRAMVPSPFAENEPVVATGRCCLDLGRISGGSGLVWGEMGLKMTVRGRDWRFGGALWAGFGPIFDVAP